MLKNRCFMQQNAPSACGSACGASDKQPEEKPTTCGSEGVPEAVLNRISECMTLLFNNITRITKI